MSNKVRTSGRARPIVYAALGGEENDLPGTTAYYLYTPERAAEIIRVTKLPGELSADAARVKKLRRDLGIAAQTFLKPAPDERIQRLQQVEDACVALRALLGADVRGWTPWKEIWNRHELPSLNISVIPADAGYPVTLPAAIATIGDLARQTRQQVASEQTAIVVYIGALAIAYAEFFGVPARISTDAETGKKRGGPFVRFAIAVANEIGLHLTPEQVRKRLQEWRRQGPKSRG